MERGRGRKREGESGEEGGREGGREREREVQGRRERNDVGGGERREDYYRGIIIVYTVYLLKIRQDKNNYCRILPKQIEIKLQISHRNAKVPNN